MIRLLILSCVLSVLYSCGVQYNALDIIRKDSLLNDVNIGIKIIDLDKETVLLEQNANKYFIPASNTKFLTMYTTLESFADSIAGWSYAENKDTLYFEPNGDPTFLNKEFKIQKFFSYLLNTDKHLVLILPSNHRVTRFGSGWSWGTWQETYSPERSIMPIYGNFVDFYKENNRIKAIPSYFDDSIDQSQNEGRFDYSSINRDEGRNRFTVRRSNTKANRWRRPFTNLNSDTLISYFLLKDTLLKSKEGKNLNLIFYKPTHLEFNSFNTINRDSLLALIMKKSDNFLTEQLLIMASKHKLARFDDNMMRRYVQDSLLSDVLVQSKWVDGSGLG